MIEVIEKKKCSSLPSTWRHVPLGEIAEITMGNSPPGESYNDQGLGVPLVNGPVEFSDGAFGLTRRIKFTTSPTKMCKAGDFLICVRGSTTGRTNVAAFDACIGRGVAAIRAKSCQQYLNHFVRTLEKQIYASGRGSTFPSISQQQLADVAIPIPFADDPQRSKIEQKRIAEILDKADAIRRKRQEAVVQFGALTESVFYEMFSHKLSSVRWTNLSDYLVELRYGTSNKSGEGGYTTLRIPNIVRGIIDLTDLKTVDASNNELEKLKLVDGDVLFVRTNGNPDYVGRCAVFEPSQMESAGLDVDEIIYASYLIRARLHLDRLRPLFLQSLLQTPAGRRNVREKCRTSAGQYNINTKGIGALQVPVVAVEEQLNFETRVRSFRSAFTSLTTAHTEADTLFNSLVQRAFKGEL